jgi:hypothetical protein
MGSLISSGMQLVVGRLQLLVSAMLRQMGTR